MKADIFSQTPPPGKTDHRFLSPPTQAKRNELFPPSSAFSKTSFLLQ